MKRLIMAIVTGLMVLGVAVYAQGPGYGPGWGRAPRMGWGQGMGPGMMGGYYGYPGSPEYEGISLEQATEVAKGYTEKYLKGFTVDRVLPFTGMRHTMYSVELKGSKGEVRYLHVNPWGGVMPFAGGGPPAAW